VSKPQLQRPDAAGTYDNCYTPPYALAPLLPYIPKGARIWEPCAGDDYLADALRFSGHEVISTDLARGADQDLFSMSTPPGVDMVITNPPYSIKPRVIAELLPRGLPWALLVPFETTASKAVRDLFPSLTSIEQMYLDGRVSFQMPTQGWAGDGAQFEVMWLSYRVTGQQITEGAMPHRLSFNRKVRKALDILKVRDTNGKVVRKVIRGRQPTREEIFTWSGYGSVPSAQMQLFEEAA
jgi:hypothetical protein